MRESLIERYFTREVKKAGGLERKIRYIGRRHASDRLVAWWHPEIDFVELKATGKTPRSGQSREHARLQKRGFTVVVIDSKEGVDAYVQAKRMFKR